MKIVELKKKIPKILILPLIILLTFSIYSGLNKLEEKANLNRISEYMKFTVISSNLIHELQRERGYSSGFIASNGHLFFTELQKQRNESDKEIERLKVFLNKFDSKKCAVLFKNSNLKLFEFLNNIEFHREKIDNLSSPEVTERYTDNINILLALIKHIVTISNDSKLTVLAQSYIMIMKIKENAGIERALISRVLGNGKLTNDEFYKFGALVTAQNIYIEQFKSTALEEHLRMFELKFIKKIFEDFEKERNKIYIKNKKNEILSSIKDYIGYGGLIHNFKNYVIRGEERYALNVEKQYDKLLIAIKLYKALDNITAQEIENLNIIKDTFSEYIQTLRKVTKLNERNSDVPALDKKFDVNDDIAINIINELNSNVYGSQSKWFEKATYRIDILKRIEDKIFIDLEIYISERNLTLSFGLTIEIVALIIIIIIIISAFTILREFIETGKMLNRAQENTRSGSYEYFFENNTMFWSDEHYKLLQVDKNTFKPSIRLFIKFIHPGDLKEVRKMIKLAISSKKITFVEYRICLLDGAEMFVRSSLEVIKYSKNGSPLIMVGTITDISQAKQLEQEIIDTQKDVIFTMGAIGETRSKETGNHVKRVAEYSKLLYLLSGADEYNAELLKMASPMHDIGKVGIPDHILNKPGALSPEEWVIIKKHSELGYEMLKNSNREILKLASIVALTHHERYDGAGYPYGLIAEEIPLVGRITALADVFDALGSYRCYKPEWELDKILELIRTERAKQFDPSLVDLFLENIDKFLEIRDKHKE